MPNLNRFWFCLLYWYYLNKRDFLWRKTSSAYKVLIAEILLQQTNARKVEEVYSTIITNYPSVCELACAEIDRLTSIIQPIGLTYRAERLINIARNICADYSCRVPSDADCLTALPGIGDYISDAVLCYAYNKPTVPIDTNVIRLFTRYYSLSTTKARARCDRDLAESIRALFIFKNTRTPNFAVLDYASSICKARTPKCEHCMLNQDCSFYSHQADGR